MYMEPAATFSSPPPPHRPPAAHDLHPDEATTKAELENLSTTAVAMIHAQNFSHPSLAEHWADPMRTSHDGEEVRVGRAALFEEFQRRVAATAAPGLRSEVLSVCAEVDLRRGRAKVWMTTVVRGLPGNIRKEGAAVLSWERRGERWVCFKHAGLGGVKGFT